MPPIFRLLIAMLLLAGALPVRAQPVEARYLGNEGVMVSAGSTRILFDPLFEEDFGGEYRLVPDAILTPLNAGAAPYDGVAAIFVSHIHPDHFSSGRIVAYLRAHPAVRLYSTREVYDAVRASGVRADDPLLTRVQSIEAAPGDPPQSFTHGTLRITAYPIPHGGRPMQHLAFRIDLPGGTSVMHLGDTGGEDAAYAPYQVALDADPPVTVFAPEWLLTDPTRLAVLARRLKPRQVIGIHASARTPPDTPTGGHPVFRTPGEVRAIAPVRPGG